MKQSPQFDHSYKHIPGKSADHAHVQQFAGRMHTLYALRPGVGRVQRVTNQPGRAGCISRQIFPTDWDEWSMQVETCCACGGEGMSRVVAPWLSGLVWVSRILEHEGYMSSSMSRCCFALDQHLLSYSCHVL